MNENTIKIRLMKAEDFDAVAGIDQKLLKTSRVDYLELKFEKIFESSDFLPISLVAEEKDGTVVGFVMGELFMGEEGNLPDEATLDTLGVDPSCQNRGIGEQLLNEFMDHLRKVGVKKLNTLVRLNDTKLIRFFSANKFSPSNALHMERPL
jgi:ribosomal protein S18 acetylase RimI-like enzyme